MGKLCICLVGAFTLSTLRDIYDHSPCAELRFPTPRKSSNSTPSHGYRQKNNIENPVRWLSSSRSDLRVLRRRFQPTPTQAI